ARLFGLGPPTGTEPLYQAAVCQATLLYGTAGLFLLMHTLRRWVGPAAAFWTAVIAWVGSPVRFYLSVLPGLAHGVEFFAAVLVLRAYLSLRERPDLGRVLRAGAACGLVFLTRSQDGLLLGLPGIELAWRWLNGPDRRRNALLSVALVAAFVVVALPQLAPGLAGALVPLMRAGVVVCALLAFLVLRYDLAVDSLRATPGDPAPVRAVISQTADRLAAGAYGLVSRASPRAASRLLGAYTGQALLEGDVTTVDLAADAPLLRLPEPARHLSAPAVEDGVASRWVNDREARLF